MPTARAALGVAGGALAAVVVAIVLSTDPGAWAATASQLQHQIAARRGQVSALSGSVGQASARASRLRGSVAVLQRRVDRLQSDLDAKRAQLLQLEGEARAARERLRRLEAAQVHTEAALSAQLVGTYESDRPDLVSVVLDSTGFSNLLETLSFAQRVGHQDAQIVARVKAARRAVAAQATRLGELTIRRQQVTTAILNERNSVNRARLGLVAREMVALRLRASRAGQLSLAQHALDGLHGQLARLQAAARARDAAPKPTSGSSTSGSSGSSPTPSRPAPSSGSSSGGFSFPMPISAAAAPANWSLDQGVDIAAPGGTPEYAVCAGTIVQHGIGGFGPSAPIIHCDRPLSGYDYVYYGHAGPGNWTPVGTHVSQGQVISEVGYGDVGISTGPHLEIGFADSSGGPVGPSSAPAMAALLHAAYGR